jgi:hypothetical protein
MLLSTPRQTLLAPQLLAEGSHRVTQTPTPALSSTQAAPATQVRNVVQWEPTATVPGVAHQWLVLETVFGVLDKKSG